MQIRSVDIGKWCRLCVVLRHVLLLHYTGNEGSAFVEVLVARSSAADDYKVTRACWHSTVIS